MKRFLKYLFLIVLVIVVTFMPVTALAKGKTCGYKGCTRSTDGCHNGTVYCDVHAAIYARESGYKVCAASGCYARAESGSSYCSSHTCRHPKCKNKPLTPGGYCSEHQCKYSGCTECAFYTSGENKGYCTKHAKSTNKKSNYSSKKKTVYNSRDYDPDDYDDPDDYAEDAWGNDFDDYGVAYDYWENW